MAVSIFFLNNLRHEEGWTQSCQCRALHPSPAAVDDGINADEEWWSAEDDVYCHVVECLIHCLHSSQRRYNLLNDFIFLVFALNKLSWRNSGRQAGSHQIESMNYHFCWIKHFSLFNAVHIFLIKHVGFPDPSFTTFYDALCLLCWFSDLDLVGLVTTYQLFKVSVSANKRFNDFFCFM